MTLVRLSLTLLRFFSMLRRSILGIFMGGRLLILVIITLIRVICFFMIVRLIILISYDISTFWCLFCFYSISQLLILSKYYSIADSSHFHSYCFLTNLQSYQICLVYLFTTLNPNYLQLSWAYLRKGIDLG